MQVSALRKMGGCLRLQPASCTEEIPPLKEGGVEGFEVGGEWVRWVMLRIGVRWLLRDGFEDGLDFWIGIVWCVAWTKRLS